VQVTRTSTWRGLLPICVAVKLDGPQTWQLPARDPEVQLDLDKKVNVGIMVLNLVSAAE